MDVNVPYEEHVHIHIENYHSHHVMNNSFLDSLQGAPLGNLYYFTWASFLASFMIMASCFEDYNAAADVTNDDAPADAAAANTSPHLVELDDQI